MLKGVFFALFVAELVTFSDRRTVTLLSSGYIL